jgi:hypothetical protein
MPSDNFICSPACPPLLIGKDMQKAGTMSGSFASSTLDVYILISIKRILITVLASL